MNKKSMIALTRVGRVGAAGRGSGVKPRFVASKTTPISVPATLGTAPAYSRHLLLRTPHPSSSWPARFESVSPLYKALGERWGKHPELKKLGFSFADGGLGEGTEKWDPYGGESELVSDSEEVYAGYLYPDWIPIPKLSLSALDAFEAFYLSLEPPPSSSVSPHTSTSAVKPKVHIYVCTHGTRDCRCGELGEPLYQALVDEVKWRKEEHNIEVRQVGHIGGHKYAGNVLLYKDFHVSDWYGLLREGDAAQLVDLALSTSSEPWWPRWRGRVGLSPEEAQELFKTKSPGSGLMNTSRSRMREGKPRVALGDPVELKFLTWDLEEEFLVTGFENESLMETARRNDLPSILATCGGNCECATCHVHIKPTSDAAASKPPLPELSDEEEEQLEFAMGRDDTSRLACQIPVTKELGEWLAAGGTIGLPRY